MCEIMCGAVGWVLAVVATVVVGGLGYLAFVNGRGPEE